MPSALCFLGPPCFLSNVSTCPQFLDFPVDFVFFGLDCFPRKTCAWRWKAGNRTERYRKEKCSQYVTCWYSAFPESNGAPGPVPVAGSSPLCWWWAGCCSLCQVSSSSAGIQHPHWDKWKAERRFLGLYSHISALPACPHNNSCYLKCELFLEKPIFSPLMELSFLLWVSKQAKFRSGLFWTSWVTIKSTDCGGSHLFLPFIPNWADPDHNLPVTEKGLWNPGPQCCTGTGLPKRTLLAGNTTFFPPEMHRRQKKGTRSRRSKRVHFIILCISFPRTTTGQGGNNVL